VPSFIAKEKRAATATVNVEGGFTIEKNLGNLIDTVYDETFMGKLGVRRITGLQGNIELPVQTAKLTVAQYAENGSIANSDLAFEQKTLSPVRLGATTQVSKQLLVQSSIDVENYIADQLAIMFQLQLEARSYTAINAAATALTIAGANGVAPTYDHMLQFEEALAIANIRGVDMGILTTYKMRRKLKGTTILANSITQAIWEAGNTVNGYKVATSNLIPSNLVQGTSGAVCSNFIQGNFKELISAQWGGMDYLVNPYTFAKEGKIEIVAQMFNNELVTRPEAFVKYSGFLTT
jgi:HK97 family phage major capsid protein